MEIHAPDPNIILADIDKFMDVLSLGRFVETVTGVMEEGYGEVILKVTVKNGSVKILSLSKTTTLDVESLARK